MSRILSTRYNQLANIPYLRLIIPLGIILTILFTFSYSSYTPSSIPLSFPPERPGHHHQGPSEWDPVPPPPPYHGWKAPPSEHEQATPEVWTKRANAVKEAFLHAYRGYEKYGAPHDEVRPISKTHTDPFNGWGVTLFDSLDTMILMGLDDEFKEALKVVESANFTMKPHHYAPYFETTIRYVGGLLAAYALSKEPILLHKVDELAEMLDPVFNTTSGLPAYGVNTVDGTNERTQSAILAEVGSFQLEYTYLAKVTRKKKYLDHVQTSQALFRMADLRNTGGMLPTNWDLHRGVPSSTSVSMGGEADSGHEYLLKLYLMTAKTDKESLEMYIRVTTYVLTNLVFVTERRNLMYVTNSMGASHDKKGWSSHTTEHLACFFPGLLALGAHTLPLDKLTDLDLPPSLTALLTPMLAHSHAADGYKALSSFNLRDVHMWAAEGLAQTCWLMYADQPTGLGPESVGMRYPTGDKEPIPWIDTLQSWKNSGARGPPPGTAEKKPKLFKSGGPDERDYAPNNPAYLLRPETIESIYLMWKVTGDAKWRDRGWAIFEAIEREAKTDVGYASIASVQKDLNWSTNWKDEQPSYFLAETLKYLYLLFDNKDPVPLDSWVFSTEAHPLPIFRWTQEDKIRLGI